MALVMRVTKQLFVALYVIGRHKSCIVWLLSVKCGTWSREREGCIAYNAKQK